MKTGDKAKADPKFDREEYFSVKKNILPCQSINKHIRNNFCFVTEISYFCENIHVNEYKRKIDRTF
jgi:hypothetical protein